MNKEAEILDRKIDLIYNLNKKSPLFIRAANTELEKGNVEKAIEILTEGIKIYPNYPTPYLLLGKAYAAAEDFNLAIKNIKTASDLLNSKETYDFYFKEFENLRKKKSLLELKSPEEKDEIKKETLHPEYYPLSDSDNLEKLAKELTSSKIPNQGEDIGKRIQQLPDEEEKPSEESLIVSDTLAKIYATQGEIGEAIKVYRKLIKKYPGKEEFYTQRIEELKSKPE